MKQHNSTIMDDEPWIEVEDLFLHDNRTRPVSWLAGRLKRSEEAVCKQMRSMGIEPVRNGYHGFNVSDWAAVDKVIRERYPEGGATAVITAIRPGLNARTIANRARRIGVRRTRGVARPHRQHDTLMKIGLESRNLSVKEIADRYSITRNQASGAIRDGLALLERRGML